MARPAQRVLGYIESGKQQGAKLEVGGAKSGDAGYFVEPAIFTNVTSEMKIVREEIFGPVAVLVKFKTEEEVIALANETVYGLSSNVFTQNISRALRVAHALEAGSTYVRPARPCTPRPAAHPLHSTDQPGGRARLPGLVRRCEAVRLRQGHGRVRARVVRPVCILR